MGGSGKAMRAAMSISLPRLVSVRAGRRNEGRGWPAGACPWAGLWPDPRAGHDGGYIAGHDGGYIAIHDGGHIAGHDGVVSPAMTVLYRRP